MCLLCFIPGGAKVDWTGLENACDNNPDGFGWTIHHGTRLEVGRFMDATAAIDSFYHARRAAPDQPAMFHARWATHGVEDLTNVHPFHVGNDYSTVIAHNGVLNVNVPKGDQRSDTRYFCEELLPLRSQRLWDKPSKVRKLRESIMGGSKFVVFTTNRDYDHPIYIVGEDLGHWDEDGTWWSNDSYLYSWKSYKKYQSGKSVGYHGMGFDEDMPKSNDYELTIAEDGALVPYDGALNEEDFYCRDCGEWLTYAEYNTYRYCGACYSCIDCGEKSGYCLCFHPLSVTSGDRLPEHILEG
jgi:hypothetical protein